MFKSLAAAGVLFVLVVGTQSAEAVDLQWNGRYRVEGIFIKNPTLRNDQNFEKSYLLHHLIMEPKIVPMDNVTIKARFDIFNNSMSNNQAGQVMGDYTGPSSATQSYTTDKDPTVTTRTQDDGSIRVTELYSTWVNDFGGFIIGRVPMQFGLGITHNAGNGMFDHFHDTRDAVMYRMVMGNLVVTPGYGKIRESELNLEDDVNEYMVDVTYEDPERDLKMGFIFDHRAAPLAASGNGNDMPIAPVGTVVEGAACTAGQKLNGTGYVGDCGSTKPDGFNVYLMNFFVARKMENFRVGLEAGFQSGYTGVKTSSGERVEWSGFGLAGEIAYKPSTVEWALKAGLASGDDPDTARVESYFFSRNYDVGMLLFNHVLGNRDTVGSALSGTKNIAGTAAGSLRSVAGIDNEVITNAIYVAPTVTVSASDRWDWVFGGVWAVQQKQTPPTILAATSPGGGTAGKNLGFETDLGWRYHPNERFVWGMDLGLLFPGDAWTGTGTAPYDGKKDFAYGLTTKAAVNF